MVYKIEDTKQVEPLFDNWQETLIWSCLQKVMGDIYSDSLDNPHSAMAVIGDFCFLQGRQRRNWFYTNRRIVHVILLLWYHKTMPGPN
jgi:hypothetical protein